MMFFAFYENKTCSEEAKLNIENTWNFWDQLRFIAMFSDIISSHSEYFVVKRRAYDMLDFIWLDSVSFWLPGT